MKGQSTEFKEYSKRVGLFQGEVICFNPNKEELEEMLETSLDKEPEYTKMYKDKETEKEYSQVNIVVWIKDTNEESGFRNPKTFSLINKPRINKDGDNFQYINDLGKCAWAKDPNDLKGEKYKWFNNREYRQALTGEEKLLGFFRAWLCLDDRNPETEYNLDYKRLFNGNFKELTDLIKQFPAQRVVANATIHTKVFTEPDDNGVIPESKAYQNLYDVFLPGNMLGEFAPEKKVKSKFAEKFISDMRGEYGCKDFCINELLRDYDPNENPINQGNDQKPEHAEIDEKEKDLTSDLPF